MTSKKSGSVGKKSGVMFSADQSGRDKKYEGYSNLKGAHDQQEQKRQKSAANEMNKGLEEEYILNLQKQIVLMEHSIKMLKEREVEQKNSAAGYETLLKDKIPLNEHILALKSKYNNEQDMLKKEQLIMEDEIKKEKLLNKQKNHKIDIQKNEYEVMSTKFQNQKEDDLRRMKKLEEDLYNESHQKDILTIERQILTEKVNKLKGSN